LPEWLLQLPRFGAVNLHGSLLPKYRGAAPIQWSLINGDQQAGVTLMQMVREMDAGDIIEQVSTPITANETYGELADRLSHFAPQLLESLLAKLESGEALTRKPQDPKQVSMAPMIKSVDAVLDWKKNPQQIHNQVRGLSPKPMAFTTFRGKRLKIVATELPQAASSNATNPLFSATLPGTIVGVDPAAIMVNTGHENSPENDPKNTPKITTIRITKVIPESRGEMSAGDFINGFKIKLGEQFV
jgi:methionyl-tRNA formyltransferase